MSATVTITPSTGAAVPLGTVSNMHLAILLRALHGRTSGLAPDLSFRFPLGEHGDDPADDVLFALQAGKGHGEVQEVTVEMELTNPSSGDELGTFTFEGASVLAYSEDDNGGAVGAEVRIRAGKVTYSPAGSGEDITFDVLSDRVGRSAPQQ